MASVKILENKNYGTITGYLIIKMNEYISGKANPAAQIEITSQTD